MKRKILSVASVGALLMLCLTGCGARRETVPADAIAGNPQTQTERELRDALAGFGESPAELERSRDYYEELLARDAFSEADYEALAGVYASLGDGEGERRMMRRAFYLYPSAERAEALSDTVWDTDSSMEDVTVLIDRLVKVLEEDDAAGLRSLTGSEEWMNTLQEAGGRIDNRVRYRDGDMTVQIRTDSARTEVTCLGATGEFLYGGLNASGSLIAHTVYSGQAYDGATRVRRFDAEGNEIQSIETTLHNDLCADSVTIRYEGVTYTGALGVDGFVEEQQQEKALQDGNLIYAYSDDGKHYLYLEGRAVSEFHMDCVFLGLPVHEIWD
ncbi:MAG: hypothetical protein NC079_04355 [Clostridium sp.]|nr:hypothetical protein [Acetatifactor muris]MCM1526715.1 hypothetical protein [Bacteroides sp.]MCM1562825.1 hypothetical protein [Clostridium sp.]